MINRDWLASEIIRLLNDGITPVFVSDGVLRSCGLGGISGRWKKGRIESFFMYPDLILDFCKHIKCAALPSFGEGNAAFERYRANHEISD